MRARASIFWSKFGVIILALLVLWVVVMISLPILHWTLGEASLQVGISGGVLAQSAMVLYLMQKMWGTRRTLVTALVVFSVTWAAEALGTHIGLLFGFYQYTNQLQPQLWGVPVFIPLAWMMMLPPAWAAAGAALRWLRLTGSRWSGLWFILLSALAFTAWDLFLDPQMTCWGFWVWEQGGSYFGIPWSNYLGWLLVSGLATGLVWLLNPPFRAFSTLPTLPLLSVYVFIWAIETVGMLFFWGLPGPALAGFVGMGIFVISAALGEIFAIIAVSNPQN